MRYAILKNGTPADAVSVRFSVAVGSSYEEPGQRGFSHFVEHMAFRGSKNYPDGELNRTLERLGLRFGADTNAFTGQNMTGFMFNLPHAKDVGEALAIARDVAGNVSFDPKAVETEAGVVMSEAALRDSPGFRAFLTQYQFELRDPRASAMPGSEASIIQHPTAEALRDYYRAWYRPERAVLVVVGDVDPDAVAKDIAVRFADWKGVGRAGRDPVFHVPMNRGLEARVFREAGAGAQMAMIWVKPPLAHPLDRAHGKQLRIDTIAIQIANRRLAAMAAEGEHPLTGASASQMDALRAASLNSLRVDLDEASQPLAFLTEARRSLLDTPVTQAELDSVVTAQKAAAQRSVASANTRTTSRLAAELASNAILGEVSSSPAQDRAILDEDLAGLTPEQVGAALKSMFGAGDPLIFVSDPAATEGFEAAVIQAYRAAVADNKPAAAASTIVPWPYTDFGPPGRVVESHDAPDIGVTTQRFANNVRLLVRPSHTRVNQVLVSVRFGSGRVALAKDSAIPNWIFGGFTSGGLGALSTTQMTTALSGKSYGLGFGLGDSSFAFGGQTTPQDLETQLQLFAAYIKDPGFRTAGFEQFKQRSINRLRTADATPSGVMMLNSAAILHAGDKRWASPGIAEISAAKVEDLKALVAPALAQGPLEVVITGDITVEAASRAVAATLGALPERHGEGPKVTAGSDTGFPGGAQPVMLPISADTAAGQTLASMSWATRGYFFADLKEDASLRMLAAILRERLLAEVRGSGLSYSVSASPAYSTGFDFGYFQANATMPAGKSQVFFDAASKTIAALKAGDIGADEFERSRSPMLASFRQSMQTNDYWSGILNAGWDIDAKFDRARHYEQALESVTPADVAAVARKYLTDGRMIKISAGM
ncbi:MAG TPA: insulinase family protein [Rhizomicrobium sp.]|nr:insulinase family protein [Rhizomicrobium sp.]